MFEKPTNSDALASEGTRVVVRVSENDFDFVSRSEAKRLTRNLDKFAEVVLDFQGVEEVGQGFADEIFRVWQGEHPEIRLIPVSMADPVRTQVERARAQGPA